MLPPPLKSIHIMLLFGCLLMVTSALLPHHFALGVDAAPSSGFRDVTDVERAGPPLMVVENRGQFDERALYQVRQGTQTLWVTRNSLWITTIEPSASRGQTDPSRGVNLRLTFEGSNPHPVIEPLNRLNSRASYFIGSNPQQWYPDVPVWEGVRYADLYPGIDLELRSSNAEMHLQFVVRDTVSLAQVRLRVDGAERGTLLSADDGASRYLRLTTAVGEVDLPTFAIVRPDGTPVMDVHLPVKVGDNVADHSTGTVARPGGDTFVSGGDALTYSTFLGGSTRDGGRAIVVDADGNAYVTGDTDSVDFPTTPGAFDLTHNGSNDVFVTKLNADGSGLIYSTYLGGTSSETQNAIGIDVDSNGNVFVTGTTDATNFPTTPGAFDTSHNGDLDVYVTKLNATGNLLLYSTFIGGQFDDQANALDVDGSGDAFITGETFSQSFPTTPGAYDTSTNGAFTDAFITRLNTNGSSLVYSTFLGGNNFENEGRDIAVDTQGNAYVTGYISPFPFGPPDFPTTPGAYDTQGNEGDNEFLTKLNAAGSGLVYSTYFPTMGSIAVDSAGNAYIGGLGFSDLPTTPGAFDTTPNGDADSALLKLDANGSILLYSTYLGGAQSDYLYDIATDSTGNVYATGSTVSYDFPTTPGAFDTTFNSTNYGVADVFVTKLNPTGSALDYSTYLGGTESDTGFGITANTAGDVSVTGDTFSQDFPTTAGAFDTSNNAFDAFIARFDVSVVVTLTPTPSPSVTATPDIPPVEKLYLPLTRRD